MKEKRDTGNGVLEGLGVGLFVDVEKNLNMGNFLFSVDLVEKWKGPLKENHRIWVEKWSKVTR